MNQLTAAQQHIVNHQKHAALVIAGPGSGKTHVITWRVVRLIEQHIPPERILLLTFTKKAAGEMLRRVSEQVGQAAERVAGGTFHSFAQKMVRRHYERLGFDQRPTIISTGDASDIIGLLREQASKKFSCEGSLPNKSELQKLFSKAINMQESVADVLQGKTGTVGNVQPIIWIGEQFQEEKHRQHVIDFDDMLVLCARLLRESSALRKAVSMRHEYILVDEYQDTNHLQYEIINSLTDAHDNIMVVGDDCQSIYAFRGANIENILTFTARFSEAAVYHLTENFRSVPAIVRTINAIIPKIEKKLEKTLLPVLQESKILPQVTGYHSAFEQAESVVADVCKKHDAGLEWEDMAILYRNSYQSNILEPFLVGNSVPFVKVGGTQITESEHGRDILSILRVRLNPLDLMAWSRVLQLIPGIGPKTVGKIVGEAERRRGQGEDIATQLASLPGSRSWSQPVRGLGEALEQMGPMFSPGRLFRMAWEWYRPYFLKKFDAENRGFRELGVSYLQMAAEHHITLESFLAELYVSAEDESAARDQAGKLVLTTMHSSKGREWDQVYIIDVIRGIHPSKRAESIDEELRLFYVACSRAKFLLNVSYPLNRKLGDTWEPSVMSPFLEGLPYIGPKQVKFAGGHVSYGKSRARHFTAI